MKKIVILLTAAVAIMGKIHKAGEQVEVDEALAKDLLHRGRGTLVEADEEIDLATMTKAQLVEFALHEYELELDQSLTKEKLIEAIKAVAEAE